MTNFVLHKLLSIQSHVVHGYVGNRAATFPLQTRGWDVDVMNTVQFSNHPAYGQFKGTRTSSDELKDLYEGLFQIGTKYDAILTGYIPSDEGLKTVGQICLDICKNDSQIKWILDPVLGDNGKIYVSEGNIQIYKDILNSGYVSLVTPNQLELEVLSGVKVTDLDSLRNALETFNQLYPTVSNIVVTSVEFEKDNEIIYSAGSTRVSPSTYKSFYFKLPKIKASFSGSGDLFSALLTSSYYKYSEELVGELTDTTPLYKLPLLHTLNEVLTIVDKVLKLTYEYEIENYKQKDKDVPSPLKINDLKLIQSRQFYIGDYGAFEPTEL